MILSLGLVGNINALQQTGAQMAIIPLFLPSDALLRSEGLINSITAPAAECVVR
jgi:hypothetical protein